MSDKSDTQPPFQETNSTSTAVQEVTGNRPQHLESQSELEAHLQQLHFTSSVGTPTNKTTQFNPFPRLPFELRTLIWEKVEQLPRFLELENPDISNNYCRLSCYSDSYAATPLLQVNYESRQVALIENKSLFVGMSVLFNPIIDTLMFDQDLTLWCLLSKVLYVNTASKSGVLAVDSEMMRKVQSIIVGCVDSWDGRTIRTLLSFEGCKSMTIIPAGWYEERPDETFIKQSITETWENEAEKRPIELPELTLGTNDEINRSARSGKHWLFKPQQ